MTSKPSIPKMTPHFPRDTLKIEMTSHIPLPRIQLCTRITLQRLALYPRCSLLGFGYCNSLRERIFRRECITGRFHNVSHHILGRHDSHQIAAIGIHDGQSMEPAM